MILAPLRTNLMAPLSTCWCGRMKGSVKKMKVISTVGFSIHHSYDVDRAHIYAAVWGSGRTALLVVWRRAARHSQSGFQCVHGYRKNAGIKVWRSEGKFTRGNTLDGRNSPSHYFDWVLFGHDVIEPWLNVRKLFHKLVFDTFDHRRFQLDTVGHILLLIKSESGNSCVNCVWWFLRIQGGSRKQVNISNHMKYTAELTLTLNMLSTTWQINEVKFVFKYL